MQQQHTTLWLQGSSPQICFRKPTNRLYLHILYISNRFPMGQICKRENEKSSTQHIQASVIVLHNQLSSQSPVVRWSEPLSGAGTINVPFRWWLFACPEYQTNNLSFASIVSIFSLSFSLIPGTRVVPVQTSQENDLVIQCEIMVWHHAFTESGWS